MILNDEEYENYVKKSKRNKTLTRLSEQYCVKFNYQKPDGYWTTATIKYHGETKSDHDEVETKWRKEYPNGELICVSYL